MISLVSNLLRVPEGCAPLEPLPGAFAPAPLRLSLWPSFQATGSAATKSPGNHLSCDQMSRDEMGGRAAELAVDGLKSDEN